ncbi:JAB domain-containing protein [Kaistella montana]|uniref:RadC family protein n=1 Tax=Kaistella montana TaxID=1849733 RepID=A0ABW5K9J7_9FLAO|nr:JAB domain-containing protein [Kaistella montana]MCQ4035767.1 JAB domain-containing protein [Kaistella montana]
MNVISEIEVSYNPQRIVEYQISDSSKTYELMLSQWNWKEIEMLEEVKLIFLNRNNIVIGIYNLAKGGISQCTVDIRIILAVALKSLSTSIILVHNHPSGNLQPSQSDKEITKNLKEACKMVQIALIDHLIITKENYYSFADEGLL